MQTKFPYYVVPVRSDDDYANEPTHCAIEVRPSVALLIAWYLVLTRLLMRASECSQTRFRFPNIRWMTVKDASEWFKDWLDWTKEEEYSESGLMDEYKVNALFGPPDEAACLGTRYKYSGMATPSACCATESTAESNSTRMRSTSAICSTVFERNTF